MKQAKTDLPIPELLLIAKRLKELRKQNPDYSNYESIAHDLGMSRSAYWRLETGANFELKTLIKVCRLLGVSLEDFFQGINLPKEAPKKKRPSK